MKYIALASLASTAMTSLSVQAFAPSSLSKTSQSAPLSMSAFPEDELLESEQGVPPTQRGKKMSESIPFLECPKILRESDLAGNVGFDPLGLSKNKEQLWNYREAEIKHARLAMLAAVGWPISELMDRSIADFFQQPTLLDDGDRVPTVLNGGMAKISPKFWGFCLGLSAAIDMYGVAKSRRGDPRYYPGNLGFDPLNLFPAEKVDQEKMKLAEIKHGRTAMVGVLGYVIEEFSTKMAVVDDTPIFFQPFTETVEEAVMGAIAMEEAVESAVVGAL